MITFTAVVIYGIVGLVLFNVFVQALSRLSGKRGHSAPDNNAQSVDHCANCHSIDARVRALEAKEVMHQALTTSKPTIPEQGKPVATQDDANTFGITAASHDPTSQPIGQNR